MSFLQFHAIAAARGDGLCPELKELFERLAVSPFATSMEATNCTSFSCDKEGQGTRRGPDINPSFDRYFPDHP
jgi:hypothetical protein